MTQESSAAPQTEAAPKAPPASPPKSADGGNQENNVGSNGETKKNDTEKTAAPKKAATKKKTKTKTTKTKTTKPKTAKKAAPKKQSPAKKVSAAALPRGIQPGVQMVPLSMIVVREGANPRLEFDSKALQEMVASLSVQGQLQPIAVAPREEDDKLEIIYGERRYRAAQMLKWKEIRADVVVDKSRQEQFVMRVAENIHRADLNAYEVARAFQGYISATGCTAKDAAETFGIKPAFLSQRLKILKMPAELQLALSKGEINFTQARELARMDPKEQVKTLNRMAKGESTRAVDITHAVEKKRAKKRAAKDDDDSGKRRGRPARTKENAPDIVRQNLDNAIEALNNFAIEQRPKTTMRDSLITLYERFTNSRSDTKKEQLRGAIKFAEWSLGIRDEY